MKYRMNSIQTSFYIIQCIRDGGQKSHYMRGVNILHISLYYNTSIQLQKVTIINNKWFVHNLYPALIQFQKAWRFRNHWIKSRIHALRKRELTGIRIFLPPFLDHSRQL
jgi:hypothetical protein